MRNIPLTFYLMALITFAFILQNFITGFTDAFVLSNVASRPWTVITSIFLHGSAEHLFSNMFALFFFGLAIESIIGGKRFAAIFFVSGIAASVISSFFYESALGASGAIFGITGALTAMRPKMAVYAFGIPLPMVVASLFWALLDLGGLFYPSGTANMAHLVGLTAGIIIGFDLRSRFREPKTRKAKVLAEEELDEWEDEYMR